MTEEFSKIEIQLIRSSLATKTDLEIAELLEKPVEDVQALINELTGGAAEDRARDVEIFKTEQAKAKEKKKKPKPKKPNKIESRLLTSTKETNEWQRKQRKEILSNQRSHRSYKSRDIDYSKMKTVRVAKGTYLWVDKTMSDEAAIQQYLFNLENNRERQHLPTNK
jgi:hypothetical protein